MAYAVQQSKDPDPVNDMSRKLRRLDQAAIFLSGLCIVHCLATAMLVVMAVSATSALMSPAIHEIGLAVAVVLGVIALGLGALNHGRPLPLALGAVGIGLMAIAVAGPHGVAEIVLTMGGVVLVATGHILNRRAHG